MATYCARKEKLDVACCIAFDRTVCGTGHCALSWPCGRWVPKKERRWWMRSSTAASTTTRPSVGSRTTKTMSNSHPMIFRIEIDTTLTYKEGNELLRILHWCLCNRRGWLSTLFIRSPQQRFYACSWYNGINGTWRILKWHHSFQGNWLLSVNVRINKQKKKTFNYIPFVDFIWLFLTWCVHANCFVKVKWWYLCFF